MTTPTNSLSFDKAHGIPPKTPASTALWAYLLRKDKPDPSPNSGVILPPITPLDKNGTSMRILLHDTQANFEKFSARVDKLCSAVEESKREISTVNTLFQREHETLTGDMVDLVNRSQTEIQKSVGAPSQAQQLSQLTKDFDMRLVALDRRIDAIQTFNQTHSQTLQIQSKALQSLQDQLGTIIAALMPLLPLIQAIPLHIESARNNIKEFLTEAVALPGKHFTTPRCSIPGSSMRYDGSPNSATHSPRGKRPGSPDETTPFPSGNKRPRVDTVLDQFLPTDNHTATSSVLQGRKPTEIEPQNITQSTTTATVMTAANIGTTTATPVKPVDLNFKLQHLGANKLSTPNHRGPRTSAQPEYLESPAHSSIVNSNISYPSLTGISSSAKRSPRLLHVNSTTNTQGAAKHKAISSTSNQEFQEERSFHTFASPSLSTTSRQTNKALSTPISKTRDPVRPTNERRSSTPPLVQVPISMETLQTRTPTRKAITPLIKTSRPANRVPFVPQGAISSKPSIRPGAPPSRLHSNASNILLQRRGGVDVTKLQSIGMPSGLIEVPVPKVRERRSPFRDGKRFILLDDSDDDSDEIEGSLTDE